MMSAPDFSMFSNDLGIGTDTAPTDYSSDTSADLSTTQPTTAINQDASQTGAADNTTALLNTVGNWGVSLAGILTQRPVVTAPNGTTTLGQKPIVTGQVSTTTLVWVVALLGVAAIYVFAKK